MGRRGGFPRRHYYRDREASGYKGFFTILMPVMVVYRLKVAKFGSALVLAVRKHRRKQ